MNEIGCRIAQRLVSALTGIGVPYQVIADIVYKELSDVANEQGIGDWLELPDGTTYTMTYKVKPKS